MKSKSKAPTDLADSPVLKPRTKRSYNQPSKRNDYDDAEINGGKGRRGTHLAALKPVTEAQRADPEKFFDEHTKSLMPDAAKEIEWALKFGSDAQRSEVAFKIAAMKGRTTNPQTSNIPPPAVFIINNSIPSKFAPAAVVVPSLAAPTLQRLDADTMAVTVNDDATNGATDATKR